MFVYVCVCVSVCVCVCSRACAYACACRCNEWHWWLGRGLALVCARIHIHVYMYASVYIYTHTCTRVYLGIGDLGRCCDLGSVAVASMYPSIINWAKEEVSGISNSAISALLQVSLVLSFAFFLFPDTGIECGKVCSADV